MWIFLAQMNKDMLGNTEFKSFCDDFTALNQNKMILAILLLQQGTFIKLTNCIQKVFSFDST